MTNDDLKNYILRYFGKEFVDVELSDATLTDCLSDAFRWYSDRKGLRAAIVISLDGSPRYDLSSATPAVQTVLEVAFPRSSDIDLRAIYGDDLALPGVPWGMFPYGALQGGVYSSLVQALQYRKTASRVISSDEDWEFRLDIDAANPSAGPKPWLYVTPGFTGPSGNAIVMYKATLTDMTNVATDARAEDYVRRRALVAAKERLGLVRGKWRTVSAAKGDRELDGDTLRSEAKEELRELNDDLMSTNMPFPFVSR